MAYLLAFCFHWTRENWVTERFNSRFLQDHQLARPMDLYNKIDWAIFTLPRYLARVGPLCYSILSDGTQHDTGGSILSTIKVKPIMMEGLGLRQIPWFVWSEDVNETTNKPGLRTYRWRRQRFRRTPTSSCGEMCLAHPPSRTCVRRSSPSVPET